MTSGQTRIGVYFGGEPPTLVPWELNVNALVLPVGTLGSLTGGMAEGFLQALGQQSQNFVNWLQRERSARHPTEVQPNLSTYIEPKTPLLLDTAGQFTGITPRFIIAASAYRRPPSHEQAGSTTQPDSEDESQDWLDVIHAGDAAEAIIHLAAQNQIARIAIPLLGTGLAGLPSIPVALDMAGTIREFVEGTSIQQVILLTRDWETYQSLTRLVQHKPQKSFNDASEGEDYLKVKAEMDALADTLLLMETEAPLAVGILGGWGSGKTFAMHMLRERMAEIRALPAAGEYIGHPYLIDFDAWTYTKSNLWSSLMLTIFLELNRQIQRERGLEPGWESAHPEYVHKIYPRTRLPIVRVDGDKEALWEQLQDYRFKERNDLKEQEQELAKKRDELNKAHQEVVQEVDQEIQKKLDHAAWKPVKDIFTKPFPAVRNLVELFAFASFAFVSFFLPLLFDSLRQYCFPGLLLSLGAAIAGILRSFDRWKKEVDGIRTDILGNREKLLKEKLDSKSEVFNSIEQEIKTLEFKVSDARRLAGVTATFDSLLELCQARLRQADYENELGLMHRVKLDLDEMDWALKQAQSKPKNDPQAIFGRGKPRIILFIDDLDRCPPQRVVEVLEATQLLLKTELFVVVLAMDVRYVTRALEKSYAGILARQGDPSGLDYIEKIIQIPYQVRPVDSRVVDDYIGSMIRVETEAVQSTAPTRVEVEKTEVTGDQTKADGSGSKEELPVKPTPVRSPRTLASISQIVTFTKEEYDFLVLCCQEVNLTPRAIKRLVNVYKLLKILWSREPRWPQPEPSVEQAIVLLLTLSCSYPDAMREAYTELEGEIRLLQLTPDDSKTLDEFFSASRLSGANKVSAHEWKKLQNDLQRLWTHDNVDELKNLLLEKIGGVLPLVRSFSFVSDIGI